MTAGHPCAAEAGGGQGRPDCYTTVGSCLLRLAKDQRTMTSKYVLKYILRLLCNKVAYIIMFWMYVSSLL